tara:strand:- start:1150 stop:1437 length:288 start_codon:yes stop_codon:yes gene_type:complete
MEIEENELKKFQVDFFKGDNKLKPEEAPLKSEEWICEFCSEKNMMTNDIKSALCTNCRKKNDIIEQMIQLAQDEERATNEKKYYDYYNKAKDQPI